MLIINNRHIPFGRYQALSFCGLIFCRSDKGRMDRATLNHEYIHLLQQRELLFVGFFVWYVAEWLWHLVRLHDRHRAYHAISFEREAYAHEHDLGYRYHRRRYAWAALLKE